MSDDRERDQRRPDRRRIRPADAVWAVGFGLVVAFFGGAVAAPPDPLSQLLWAAPLVVVTVPGMYVAVTRARARRRDGARRLLVTHFVVTTLAGGLLAGVVGGLLDAGGLAATLARALAFAGTFLVITWLFYRRQ
jgi:FtsH-binding integral membrane protein